MSREPGSAGGWIFGYGSLIWRPDFPFVRGAWASLEGMARRFWQGSPDHRGTEAAPGRVVTLVEAPGDCTVGRVFEVAADVLPQVLAKLDVREAGGYVLESHPVRVVRGEGGVEAGAEVQAWVYRATPANPWWLGEAPPKAMAAHIAGSAGPSGDNATYLLALDEALRAAGWHDPHVKALADAVRGLAAPAGGGGR
jgi:cation transport regulator ChaC